MKIIQYSYSRFVSLSPANKCPYFQVGQIQESIDLLNRKLNEAEMSHQVSIVSFELEFTGMYKLREH